VTTFEGLAVLAPIINGIGGNLGAVLASRVSTALHSGSRYLPVCCHQHDLNQCSQPHRKAGISLFLLVVPTSLIFLLILAFLGAGHTPITAAFLIGYNVSAAIQVRHLRLHFCHNAETHRSAFCSRLRSSSSTLRGGASSTPMM
jgi:solute carrier family 41